MSESVNNATNCITRTLTWISRILFGGVFIIAGFVKAIDPLGSAYKFEDYFMAFGVEWMFPLALPLAILMNAFELLAGIAILAGLKIKISAWVALLFMVFFTPLTFYIAIYDPVPDCGCFGDAIIISNWETFYKNVVILIAAIIIFVKRDAIPPLWSKRKDWYLIGGAAAACVALSLYCLVTLPLIDFRPWKTGNDMNEELKTVQEEVSEYFFVYKNSSTGEQKPFGLDELPTDQVWEFVERQEIVIQEYIPSPITNFFIRDEEGKDLTHEVINHSGYLLLAVSYDLNQAHRSSLTEKLNAIAIDSKKDNILFIGLTSSAFSLTNSFIKDHEISYDIFQSNERELKTIIRSNPGLVLLENGVVIKKWHHRNIPSYDEIKEKFMIKS